VTAWTSAALVGLFFAQADAATDEALPLPPRLTADVRDSLGLRTNPAGLGALQSSELRLLYGFQPGSSEPGGDGVQADLHSGGLYGAAKIAGVLTLAGGYDFSERGEGASAERGLVGLGIDLGVATWGFAWELRDDFGRGEQGFVRLGMQSRFARWAALGLAVQDVAEAIGSRSWDIGLAIRPGLDWLTLSSQWRLTEEVELSEDTLDLRFLLGAEPVSGLILGVGADHDFDRLDFQLAIDFGQAGTEGAVLVRDEEPLGSAQLVARAEPAPAIGQRRRMIVVDLEGDLAPDPTINLLQQRFQIGAYGSMPLLLRLIARSDDASGAFLRIGSLDVGWGKVRELRAGIEAIRDRGKPVVCSVDLPSDREYYLASACQLVVGLPSSVLAVDGVSANLLFLGEGLSTLGIDVEAVKRSEYKTAPNVFTRSEPTPEQEEVAMSILDETYGTLVDGIARGREVDRSRVVRMVDRGTVTATEAVARGWLDATLYPDQVEDWIREQVGGVVFGRAEDVVAPRRREWGTRPQIAVILIDSVITGGESRLVPFGLGATSGATTLVEALKTAREDDRIRAIVLRIDSPGGDAVASDLIARAIRKAAREKPVVASFGDVAASGGYYVAAPTQYIFAEPTTVTGSIGVFSLRASFSRLMSKLGISATEYERGRHANLRSPLQPLKEEDRKVVERQVEFFYDRFLRVVARGRDLPLDDVRSLAQGRVWTGAEAQRRGLVDELGGLSAAISHARDAAGLSPTSELDLVLLPDNRRAFPEYVRRWFEADGEPEASDDLAAIVPERLHPLASVLASLTRGQVVALPTTWVELD